MEGLEHGYAQHVADAQRRDREAKDFESWAIETTWKSFLNTAKYSLHIPDIILNDWQESGVAHSNWPGGEVRLQPASKVLARRILNGLVLTRQLLRDMESHDQWTARATWIYLRKGNHGGSLGNWAKDARRYVYDWLTHHARLDNHSRRAEYVSNGRVRDRSTTPT